MSSLHADSVNKPVETIHPDNTPGTTPDHVTQALIDTVERTDKHADVQQGIHAPMHRLAHLPFASKFVPELEKIAAEYHVGNFVAMRGTDERFFESMPLYPRLGMHLLYYGSEQVKVLQSMPIEATLRDLSKRQGQIYDKPESVKSIPSFIQTYSIQTAELLYPDISAYKTFNEFFYRKLKPDARPVQNADDPNGFCSAADCRLTVYNTVDLAQKFWIKGSHFSIPALLDVAPDSETAQTFANGGLAIFRLAPADYHRFHSPLDGVVGDTHDIPGQYYTVNPQAVNEPGFDVFTANKRSVLYITHSSGQQVAFVAIGAMLVGSIGWTGGSQKGTEVKRGDELGYFAYGGSTIVAVFPKGLITFDEDLAATSQQTVETLMKVGWSMGTHPSDPRAVPAAAFEGPAGAGWAGAGAGAKTHRHAHRPDHEHGHARTGSGSGSGTPPHDHERGHDHDHDHAHAHGHAHAASAFAHRLGTRLASGLERVRPGHGHAHAHAE